MTSERKSVSHADVAGVVCGYLTALRMVQFDFSRRPDLASHEWRLKSLGAEFLKTFAALPLSVGLEVSEDCRRARRRLPGTAQSYVVWEASEPVHWPLPEAAAAESRDTVWTAM